MNQVIRNPTVEDRNYVGDDGAKIEKFLGVDKDPNLSFEEELSKEMLKALKKGLPFAERVAREEYKEKNKAQIQSQLREYGSIKHPEKLKKVKLDWSKYSNLKNFEIVDEGKTYDEYLSKRNPGLSVEFEWKKYKFKGYSNIYTVMEDRESALRRAQENRDKQFAKNQK